MMAQPVGPDVLEELSREQLKDLCKLYLYGGLNHSAQAEN